MDNQFATLAEPYNETVRMAMRQHLEIPAVLDALGDLSGRAILDMGCGTGAYARLFRRRGAQRVLGIDASAGMLDLARAAEQADPLGISYLNIDAAHPVGQVPAGAFDVVTAIYVLCYAQTWSQLSAMCATAAVALRAGGRFLAHVPNPDVDTSPGYYSQYGVTRVATDGPRQDGAPLVVRMEHNGHCLDLTPTYWSRKAYDTALSNAGFTTVTWLAPEPTDEGVRSHAPGFWDNWRACPYSVPVIAHAADHARDEASTRVSGGERNVRDELTE